MLYWYFNATSLNFIKPDNEPTVNRGSVKKRDIVLVQPNITFVYEYYKLET